MPELPEVTTTVNGLKETVKNLKILNFWTDLSKEKILKQFENTIKNKKFLKYFITQIKNQKIVEVERRAKNILIHLANKKTILIHLKMTGHIIYGKYIYIKKENKWIPSEKERKSLHDPYNRFVHAVFSLSNGKSFVLCDSRKFGKITLIDDKEKYFKNTGPEPLLENFLFKNFKERLILKKDNFIKTILMDQSIIAGIGNIYSDEMLWLSGIHPESKPKIIPDTLLKNLFVNMKKVLRSGIDFGGDSMSDYRNIYGEKGSFQNKHNVYQKTKEKCLKKNCSGVIIKKVINGRSSHFCNKHQILFR
jgi:formamidopyrimidine-DNA glycosylase